MRQVSQKTIIGIIIFLVFLTSGITVAYRLTKSKQTTQTSAAGNATGAESSNNAGRLPTGKPQAKKQTKGDYNADGAVNQKDFPLFMIRFKSGDSSADLDGNGVVNSFDLTLFRQLAGI